MPVQRFDRSPLKPAQRGANGWLNADAYIGRSGFLEYTKADGTPWVEYRPAEEAFKPEALSSFEMTPLTNDHPPVGRLDAENTKLYQVGTVGKVEKDGDKVRARILVTDAATIADIEAGKQELSCGYLCDLDLTPGEVDGRRFDARQLNIRGNHVALVTEGRAGSEVRLRLDHNAELSPMKKIKIDGVEAEVSEQAAQLLEKVADREAKLSARADAAEAQVAKLTKNLAELPAQIKAQVAARADLVSKAQVVLGAETRLDALTDLQIKCAVAEKATGLKLDGKSEAYVDAAYEIALAKPVVAEPVTAAIPKADESDDSIEAHQRRFNEAARNAYKARK